MSHVLVSSMFQQSQTAINQIVWIHNTWLSPSTLPMTRAAGFGMWGTGRALLRCSVVTATGVLITARWLVGSVFARGATTTLGRLPSFVVFASRALNFCNQAGSSPQNTNCWAHILYTNIIIASSIVAFQCEPFMAKTL